MTEQRKLGPGAVWQAAPDLFKVRTRHAKSWAKITRAFGVECERPDHSERCLYVTRWFACLIRTADSRFGNAMGSDVHQVMVTRALTTHGASGLEAMFRLGGWQAFEAMWWAFVDSE